MAHAEKTKFGQLGPKPGASSILDEGCGVHSLDDHLLWALLRKVSKAGTYRHALVCRRWAQLSPDVQARVRVREDTEVCPGELLMSLQRFPNLEALGVQKGLRDAFDHFAWTTSSEQGPCSSHAPVVDALLDACKGLVELQWRCDSEWDVAAWLKRASELGRSRKFKMLDLAGTPESWSPHANLLPVPLGELCSAGCLDQLRVLKLKIRVDTVTRDEPGPGQGQPRAHFSCGWALAGLHSLQVLELDFTSGFGGSGTVDMGGLQGVTALTVMLPDGGALVCTAAPPPLRSLAVSVNFEGEGLQRDCCPLTSLTSLDLSRCLCLPRWLGSLRSLKRLVATNLRMASCPVPLATITRLNELALEFPDTSEELLEDAGESHQNFGMSFEALGDLQALKVLKITNSCGICLPESISRLQGLERLTLTLMSGEEFPASMSCLRILTYLYAEVQFMPSFPTHAFSHLQELHVRYLHWEEAALMRMVLPGSLKRLTVEQDRIGRGPRLQQGDGTRSVGGAINGWDVAAPPLEFLEISDKGGAFRTPGWVEWLVGGSQNHLETLWLGHCIVPTWSVRLSKLRKLALDSCRKLTSLGTLTHLQELQELKLIPRWSTLLRLPEGPEVAQGWPRLSKVELEGLKHWMPCLQHLPSLRHLCVREQHLGVAIKDLLLPPSIEVLDLSGVALTGDEATGVDFPGPMPALRVLKLQNVRKGMTQLPPNLGSLQGLRHLVLRTLVNLESLPSSFSKLSGLLGLVVQRCPKLIALPLGAQDLPCFRLQAGGTAPWMEGKLPWSGAVEEAG